MEEKQTWSKYTPSELIVNIAEKTEYLLKKSQSTTHRALYI
jgi:hypothetical protein